MKIEIFSSVAGFGGKKDMTHHIRITPPCALLVVNISLESILKKYIGTINASFF